MTGVYALTVVLEDEVSQDRVDELKVAITSFRDVVVVRENVHNPVAVSDRAHAKQDLLKQLVSWLEVLE